MAESEHEDVAIAVRGPAGDTTVAGALHRPASRSSTASLGVLVLHGFPSPVVGAQKVGLAYRSLAERIAAEVGCHALSIDFRGCGESPGQFSVQGWRDDCSAALDHLRSIDGVTRLAVVGYGTGGALGICVAGSTPEVDAVAAMGPPADFADWARDPQQLAAHCRQLGLITVPDHPDDFRLWSRQIENSAAADHAGKVAPRPLLVVHGADDELVPVFDARIVADAHGAAELRILDGAGHGLRFDPRAVAILLAWIERQS